MTLTRTGWRFVLTLALASVNAQELFANSDLIPPTIETKTPTGISLSDGAFTFTRTDLSIGTLKLERFYRAPVSTYALDPAKQADASKMFHGMHSSNNFDIFVMPAQRRNAPNTSPMFYGRPIVHIGDTASGIFQQMTFTANAAVSNNSIDSNAGLLRLVGSAYEYTDASGTVYKFNPSVRADEVTVTAGQYEGWAQRVASITYPDGRLRSFSYVGTGPSGKLKLVTDSTGYAIVFDWNADGYISAACGFNLSQTYVTTSTTCTDQALKVSYGYGPTNNNLLTTAADVLGQVETYEHNSYNTITCLKPPGFVNCAISNVWGWSGNAGSITQNLIDGTSWQFGLGFYDLRTGGRRTEAEPYGDDNVGAIVRDPNGKEWDYVFSDSAPRWFTDPTGRYTTYEHQMHGATAYDDQVNFPALHNGATLIQATFPEGNAYLTERNGPYKSLTKETWRAKPGSGQPDIVKQYIYESYVGPAAQITKPNHVIDGRGNQTDYVYETHGGVRSEMQPAPTPGAPRPLKVYTYTQKYAYIKNSSGSLIQAATPVTLPATVTLCQTAAGSSTPACDSSAMQTVTTFEYGANGTANTLNLLSEVVSWNGQTRRTCYGYDDQGNKLWEIRPRAGLSSCPASAGPSNAGAFTWAWRYDAKRRVTGTLAPDPDGANALKHAATRNTYDDAGRLIKVESGELATWLTEEEAAPASWTGFTIYSKVETSYDGLDRKTLEVNRGSDNVAFAATQYSYDPVGRLECTAVRMNPAAFSSLPGACTVGTAGSFGADRITRNEYYDDGKLKKVQRAYGTPKQQDYVAYTYTDNGKVEFETDANGNLSKRTYDGHDRLVRLDFPAKTSPGNITGSDYEQYSYDANGNRLSLRKRDTRTIGYTYDALNRLTDKDIPAPANADVHYDYDTRGLMLYAGYVSSGLGITTTYDGFGGKLTSTDNTTGFSRSLSYQYDADGNRTRLTYPDGNYFSYSYDGLDRMSAILQSGSTTVSSLAYNARGLRSSLTGGVSTSYGFNAAGRLSSLGHDLASTAQDVSFTYPSYNPAGQLISQTRNNDSYAYAGIVTGSQSYDANGLNQYDEVAGVSIDYDDNANLEDDGSSVYVYDTENRLTSVTGASSATLSYDPLGRLLQVISGSSTTQFLYDGDKLIAEYNGTGTLLRRYVHGPGSDEPLLWYEGSALTNRRHLRTDHQGSVIAVTDSAGTSLAINSYDEYGRPGSGNMGRFQYTGQAYLPEIGMYHYKARVYDPKWGRFLQTDPIGYTDDYNLYAYVGNDPANGVDPTGTEKVEGQKSSGSGTCSTGTMLGECSGVQSVGGSSTHSNSANGNASGGGFSFASSVGAALPEIPQGTADALTGLGDGAFEALTLGFGNLQSIRDSFGIGGDIDKTSGAYRGFELAGNVAGGSALGGMALRGLSAVTGPARSGPLHTLNHNRYVRVGPGKMGAPTKTPRLAIGPEGSRFHFHLDLRIRPID